MGCFYAYGTDTLITTICGLGAHAKFESGLFFSTRPSHIVCYTVQKAGLQIENGSTYGWPTPNC